MRWARVRVSSDDEDEDVEVEPLVWEEWKRRLGLVKRGDEKGVRGISLLILGYV